MRCLLWIVLVCLSTAMAPAWSQNYPSHPVRIFVPFGPGSGSDIVARHLGRYLERRWKQAVIIENRPGAQGVIGTEALRTAAADGYTLGISTNSTHAAAPYLVKDLPYDPLADFEHVALIGVGGAIALVPKDSPFKTLSDLATHAKAHPGNVFFGHADTIAQIPGELLKEAGLPVVGVPYKSSSIVIADLLGGRIQFAFFNAMTAAAQAPSGRLLPIAITESKRHPRWPTVPTVSETYPGFEVTFFIGISAPRGVPADIVATIHRAIQEAEQNPALKEPLESAGLTFVRLPAGGYRTYILKEAERWRGHVRAAGLTPQ